MKIDLLFPAWNRKAFTVESFQTMLANTDWEHVAKLFIYDDGSVDGTREWLAKQKAPVPIEYRETRFGTPVLVFADFLKRASASVVAKIDNDVILPPLWLNDALYVMQARPALAMLGIEAMYEDAAPGAPRDYAMSTQIGGIGLFRREIFKGSLPKPEGSSGEKNNYRGIMYWGMGSWQVRHPQHLRGWIRPSLRICLLNLLPFEPWLSLSREYVRQGWQRDWPHPYPQNRSELWSWKYPNNDNRGHDAGQERGPLDRAERSQPLSAL